MGIDIYLGGWDAYKKRTRKEQTALENAVKLRDSYPHGGVEAKAAQELVDAAYDAMHAGNKGYLRSSYNNAGLFNVLDRLFGIDSAALLFPGNWEEDLAIDWDDFLAAVHAMKECAKHLKHGMKLPIEFAPELIRTRNDQRSRGEEFGKAVLEMVTTLCAASGDDVKAGNDHQHGFYNEDDYGWYVTTGLDELEAFGKLGKRWPKQKVCISY